MAKKKAVGKFAVGAKVRVKPGVVSPEFPDFQIAGWSGTVAEATGKESGRRERQALSAKAHAPSSTSSSLKQIIRW